jgi:pyrroline-5-carboxylate reductase
LIEVEAKVRVPYIPSELLRAALKPFADAVTDLPAYYNDEQRYISAVAGVNLEDFETAFRVLKRLQKKVRP